METINSIKITKKDLECSTYSYQEKLTLKLDELNSDFNQEIINEIVLWKINRYAYFPNKIMNLLNKINKSDSTLDIKLTSDLLKGLLGKESNGIRLAMASTILRFKNPYIYQIIDQRVYRFIYGKSLKYSVSNIESQIDLYLKYLIDLKNISKDLGFDFKNADRILYEMDKKYNKNLKIKY